MQHKLLSDEPKTYALILETGDELASGLGRFAADQKLAGSSFKGAGIGAGVGSAVGLAKVLLTRGNEVDLHQGTTLDVVFDRAVTIE